MRLPSLLRSPARLLLPALALALTLYAACGQVDPNTPIPTSQAYRPPPTRENMPSELQRRQEARESTRIAILTAVPQVTLAPDWTPPPVVWSTPVPIPSTVLYSAGAGMILEDGQVDLPSDTGSFKNQWYVQTANGEIRVYAGAEKRDVQQGLLFVSVRNSPQPRSIDGYYTPLRAGAVRIISAVGERLTLRAADGTLFAFDVPTRQWVNPPATPIATATLTRPDQDATKVSRYEQQRQDWAAMSTNTANGTPFVYTPIAIPTTPPRPTRVLGLYNGCIDPDPYYTYRSCWVGRHDNEYLFVSAGAIKPDPTQGMLQVYTTTLDELTWGPEHTYFTPAKAGPVLITTSTGNRLTLRAENGTVFTFDVLTRQWVNTNASPAPSVTPWPTSVPQPTPVVGPQSECAWGIHNGFFDNSCWVVQLNNDYLYLFGGWLYNIRSGDLSDETMGALLVSGNTTEWYPTPQQIGPVRIVTVQGSSVILQTTNTQSAPVTFVFDLLTRRWVKPPAELGL